MAEQAPDETLSLLTRLSQKPGVQSTLVLSRDTGAIVRTSGLISRSSAANPNSTLPATSPENSASDALAPNANGDSVAATGSGADAAAAVAGAGGMQSAEDVARMVFSFVKSSGELVNGLDGEDEVKLLRVRTKKHELVIVPGAKFLLVAIHETPPA